MSKKEWFSYSKLATYDSCPKKYYYRYIEKPNIKTDSVILQNMQDGTNFHKFAENLFKILKKNRNKLHENNFMNEHFKDKLDNVGPYEKTFFSLEEFKLKNHIENNTVDNFLPKFVEKKVVGNIGEFKFIGYIDRVNYIKDVSTDFDSNGTYSVFDYKGQKGNLTPLRKQLIIYSLLLSMEIKQPVEHMGAYFYKNGEYWDSKIKNVSLNSTMKFIDKNCRSIITDDVFNKTDNTYICENCEYKELCSPSFTKKRHITLLG